MYSEDLCSTCSEELCSMHPEELCSTCSGELDSMYSKVMLCSMHPEKLCCMYLKVVKLICNFSCKRLLTSKWS